MAGDELKTFEEEAAMELERTSGEVQVSEGRVLSPKVLEILVKNAYNNGETVYKSEDVAYKVSFAYIEIKMKDGNVGVYDKLPDAVVPESAEAVAFTVMGFHKSQETEVQFYKGKILLNREREHKHLINFQRSVLQEG